MRWFSKTFFRDFDPRFPGRKRKEKRRKPAVAERASQRLFRSLETRNLLKILVRKIAVLASFRLNVREKNGVPLFTTAGKVQPHDTISIPGLTGDGIKSEIISLYDSRHSLPEISRITGISRTRVRSTLIEAGVYLAASPKGSKASARRSSGQVRWNSPYGFKYLCGRLVPHPQEFETLRLILKWAKSDSSFEDISSRLNDQKLRPRKAPAWTRFTVRQILKWHEAHPEVLRTREGNVVTHEPWKIEDELKKLLITKPKAKKKKTWDSIISSELRLQ
jgi:hypothetical protein